MGLRIGTLRDSFDATCNFFVVKPMTCLGKAYAINQQFDKDSVDTRKLRQLYEGRYLRQEDAPVVPREPRERPVFEIGNMVKPTAIDGEEYQAPEPVKTKRGVLSLKRK